MKYSENAEYINKCISENKFQHILERVFLKRKEFEFVEYINGFAPSTVTRWVEKLYWYLNNLKSYPKCDMCDNKTTFISVNEGYRRFCSAACTNKCDDVLEKRDNTMMDRYGVKYALSAPVIREKIKHTCIEKYGVESSNQSSVVKDKMKQSLLDRYGVDNSSKSEEVKKKKRKNNLKKYGYEYASQRPDIKEKTRNTNLERFGTNTPLQNADVRAKMEATNMERYGVVNVLSSQEIIDKRINTVKDTKLVIINNYLSKDNLQFISYDADSNIIRCKCNTCNEENEIKFQLLYLRHKNDKIICTVCNPLYDKNTSYDEQELLQFIKDNYDGEIQTHVRDVIAPYELDIYLPELNVAFEYNGLYWHSELFKAKGYHKQKKTRCKNNGVELLNIFEDAWKYKNDIIKSIILNKLNKTEKIYARKCIVHEIKNDDYKTFLNNNHIQGYIAADVKLGLYYNDVLVSVMSFANRKLYKNNGTELMRFCNKLNMTVIGGASKLFKHYVDNYEYTEIISYSNNDMGSGGMYEKLGFKYIKDTVSNYWWVVDDVREYRFKWSKQELIKNNLLRDGETENACMARLGYYRIFDSGSKIWKYYK